jgi:hypothetical protein
MKSAMRFSLLLILLAALGSAQFLLAQGTDLGTITGLVTDSTGAVVPSAKVVILDLATNTPRETKTNAQGEYRVFGLRVGKYQVSVSVAGMRTTQITGIEINGSDVVRADAALKLASASETVDVSAEAPLVNTNDQTISDTFTSRTVVELPRDSRDVYTFLYLNPNIAQGPVDGAFKFLGAQSYGANFALDGQRSNGGIFGEPTDSKPSLEAVGDVNVLSNDFSAEYPGIANIRVTTKRGGSGYHGSMFYNNKNSELAATTQADILGKQEFAPTPFQSKYPNPYFNFNDIGGSFGGPIPGLKKTWFFMAYERNWAVQPVNVNNNNLPHPSLWAGDFSLLNDPAKPNVPAGVTLTPEEIANNTVGGAGTQFITIPARLLNPTVQTLISTFFPQIGLSAPINAGNGRVPGFHTIMPTRSVQDLGTLRVDHDFSEKDRVYVVYNGSARTFSNALVQTPYTGLGLRQNDRRNDTLSVSYTRMFTTNIVNEARAGYNHQKLRIHSNNTLEGFLSSVGFDQSDIDAYGAVAGPNELKTFGHAAVSFNNTFVTFQNGGRNTDRPQDQDLVTFGDTLTWVVRKHNLKMGADFVRNAAVDGFAVNRGNPRGLMTYSTGGGTNPFTAFVLGLGPTSVSYINEPRPPMDVYNWETGYFFQDDWKVTPRLTLNLGVRYELITPFVDTRDLMVNFDPKYVDSTTGLAGRFIVPSEKTIPFLDTRIPAIRPVVTASESGLGVGRGLVRTDKNNIAPRIGFALRVGSKSVVRGGYGFYYPTSAAQGIRDPLATNAFNQGLTKRNFDADDNPAPTPLQPWPGFAHGFSPLTGGVITTGFGGLPSINAVPVELHQPRIQQYNATFEREIARDTSLRLSYLGSTLSGLIGGVDLEEIPASDNPFGTTTGDGVTPCTPSDGDCTYSPADLARQPFPGLGDYMASYGNFGRGRSNAFQTQLEHRYSHGLMLNLAYTYLDQKSTALDMGNSSLGGLVYNPFEPNHDYGQEGFVPKNRFIAYGVYDLPLGKGRRFGSSFSSWADVLLGGWQTSFNIFAKSGTGFTPYWICDNCGPAVPGNVGVGSVDAVGDFNNTSFRPLVTGSFNHRDGNQIWDPNAFDLPPFGADVFDNPKIARRNLLIGPGTWGVNLGVHKEFHFGERVTASLGADVDNLFNHPLFSPDNDYGGGGGPFSQLGDFEIAVNPTTLQPEIARDPDTGDPVVNHNDDFGRLKQTFSQEGVADRRTIRLRLRITF